jgi:hypothetical protein
MPSSTLQAAFNAMVNISGNVFLDLFFLLNLALVITKTHTRLGKAYPVSGVGRVLYRIYISLQLLLFTYRTKFGG